VKIHPTAIVDPGAVLAPGVVVGPYSLVDAHVTIGARTVIGPHVRLTGYTTLGEDCVVHTGAVLGEPPQDLKFKGDVTYLSIGQRNVIREHVTMHLATGEGNTTRIGDDNFIMAHCHIGHNCTVGNRVVMANYVGLAGGTRIDDGAILGGHAGFHQFVHVGRLVMIGGMTKVAHDIPPFTIADGPEARLYGLNVIGLKRNGVEPDAINAIKKAYRLLCYRKGNFNEALAEARATLPADPAVTEFIDFVERSGRNGRHLDPRHAVRHQDVS
jgi:UDP-N-acetylglucosamine acyltransferase